MIIVVVLFKQVIPITNSRVLSFIYSAIYGIIGALTYFFVSVKTNLLYKMEETK